MYLLKLTFLMYFIIIVCRACDDIAKVLGFDWLLLFMQCNLHADTVVLALRVLLVMFRNIENIRRFREGSYGGGWMGGTETVLKNQMSVMLGEFSFCKCCSIFIVYSVHNFIYYGFEIIFQQFGVLFIVIMKTRSDESDNARLHTYTV